MDSRGTRNAEGRELPPIRGRGFELVQEKAGQWRFIVTREMVVFTGQVADLRSATIALPTMKLTALAALLSTALFAQETPTERDAAREVLKKMDALEKSLDVPGWVARLGGARCGSRPGDGARQGADGYRAARHGRRYHAPPRDRLPGEALGRHADAIT